ncbi:MAG: hypothetical protein RPR97_09500, partial [Colwellia sp.]
MKKKFISVPIKLLIMIVSTLLILAIGFSTLSLSRMQDDYKKFQQATLDHGQAQFTLHSDILRSKLNVWLESFAEITKFSQQRDFTVFAQQLSDQFDGLQLNLNVENIWLVDKKKESLFSTSLAPIVVQESVNQVLKFQQPHHQIYCPQQCVLLFSLPLLNNQGDVVVVTMTASLVDMLYAIKTSLNSDVAVVSLDSKSRKGKVISASNMPLVQSLMAVNKQKDITIVLRQGIQIDLIKKNYLVNLLPLAESKADAFYLALINDITSFETQNSNYWQQFIISLISLFTTVGLLIYLVARPFTKRLLRLSNALPLLANKKFDQ